MLSWHNSARYYVELALLHDHMVSKALSNRLGKIKVRKGCRGITSSRFGLLLRIIIGSIFHI